MLLLRRMYLGTCSAILGCFSRKTTTLNLGGGGLVKCTVRSIRQGIPQNVHIRALQVRQLQRWAPYVRAGVREFRDRARVTHHIILNF